MNAMKVMNNEENLDLNTKDTVRAMAVADTAVPMAAFDGSTTHATINVSGAAIRATFDGTTPEGGAVGALFGDGFNVTWPISMVSGMKVIRNAGTSAVVTVIPRCV